MMQIVSYRKCLSHRLDKRWEWSCAVWFGPSIFADAVIKNAVTFKTKREAVSDMKEAMKKFGITKKTERL